MKIIKQLSENQFVIEMEDHDLNKQDEMIIAHDYVRFISNSGIQTDWRKMEENDQRLYGPYKSVENWIRARHIVTLSVRQMQEIIIPYLLKHNYLKPEHLLNPDGTPNYTWGQEYGTVIHDHEENPGKHFIYQYRKYDNKYDVMTLDEHENLYTGINDVDDNKLYEGDIVYNFKDRDGYTGKIIYGEDGYNVKIIKCKNNDYREGSEFPFEDGSNFIKQG